MAGQAHIRTDLVPDDSDRAAAIFGVGLALVVGGTGRILPFFGTDFPLNYGGLFGTMIQDLVDNRFLLPTSTTYNGLDSPFAYPLLACYVAGVGPLLGVAIIDTLRGVPLLFSLACVIAVYRLAAGVLRSRSGGMLAALALALLPRSYLVLITGGGLYYSGLRPSSPLHGLDTEQQAALLWAGDNTPGQTVFAVMTNGIYWEGDAISEWSPALTGRRSAATVQGYEWLGLEAWQRQQNSCDDLQDCARDVLPCVVAWADRYD